jgi:type II secretory pathway component PulK
LNQKWAGGFGTTNSTIEFITLTNNVLGPGTFSVRIEDLERRININLATPEMLQRALELMGYDTLVAATVTDSIGDWLDRDSVPRMNGAESDDYLSLPKPYVAKNGIMDDLSELLLIRGVTSEMFWGAGRTNLLRRLTPQFGPRSSDVSSAMAGSLGLVDFFSIGGLRTVNLNTASREVLQILPGMDENLADGIVRMRAGLDGVEGTEDDTPLHNVGELVNVAGVLPQMAASLRQVCGVTSTFFEVRVQVWVERYERTYVALLYRNLRPGGRATENSVSVLTAGWD